MPFCGRAGPRYRSHRNESDEERRNSTSSGFFLICFSFFFCFPPSPCHFRRRPKARNSLPGRFSVVFFSYFFFTKIGRCFFLSSSFFFLSNCLSYFWEMERNVGPLCWSFRTSRIGLRIFRFVFHSTVESSKTKLKTKIEKKTLESEGAVDEEPPRSKFFVETWNSSKTSSQSNSTSTIDDEDVWAAKGIVKFGSVFRSETSPRALTSRSLIGWRPIRRRIIFFIPDRAQPHVG